MELYTCLFIIYSYNKKILVIRYIWTITEETIITRIIVMEPPLMGLHMRAIRLCTILHNDAAMIKC
ncbi:hypothetical protein NEPAR04_2295 [Nematocida parisii]|nr:hypothetical protein NEPAR08_2274 [Nematocida parisii]KAI5144981.1 hypothetical protein NEPAR04_2295 [Nematocida parisii]